MPKGAYEDLMKAVGDYEKSGAAKRDVDKKRRDEEEKRKRAQEEEQRRLEREGRGATGARVRQGFRNREEMREAIEHENASKQLLRPRIPRGQAAPRG